MHEHQIHGWINAGPTTNRGRIRLVVFRALLFVEMSAAAVIAAAMILPFDVLFAAILAVAVVPLVVYPYWRDVRAFPSWWAGVPRPPFILATLAGVLRYTCAAVWLYFGFVATLVLPHHTGSWGYVGGTAAMLVGLGFALAAWRGVEQRKDNLVTVSP